MSYKQIHETFWTDPDVKKYPRNHRWIFAYFITGPHTHYSGLYYVPMVYIQNETGCTEKEIKASIAFLTEKGHILYDYKREVIFVKSEMLYQLDNIRDGKVILNAKHLTGLRKHFDTLHRSPLIDEFLKRYPYLNVEYRGIDTRIDTGMDRDSVTVPVTVQGITEAENVENSQYKNPEPKKPIENIIPPEKEWVIAYCKERNRGVSADKWYDHYLRNGWKVGKAATPMKDWKAAVRTWEDDSPAKTPTSEKPQRPEKPAFVKKQDGIYYMQQQRYVTEEEADEIMAEWNKNNGPLHESVKNMQVPAETRQAI